MHVSIEDGPLPRLDARLRSVGQWLLVGDTVTLVLVTFVVPQRQAQRDGASVEVPTQVFVG